MAGKKTKKIVTDGVAHIHSSFNNTIVTITDKKEIQFVGQHQAALVLKVQEKAHLLLHKLLQKKLEMLQKSLG